MIKQNKTVNLDQIRPSLKPTINHSLHLERIRKPQPDQHKSFSPRLVKEPTTVAVNKFQSSHFYEEEHSVASSFSLEEEDGRYEYEQLLFAKFVQSKCTNWMSFMHSIRLKQPQELLTTLRIGETEQEIKNNELLCHYIAVWLRSMGYLNPDTKQKIVMNLEAIFPSEPKIAEVGCALYDSLLHGYLPPVLQLRVLLETCRRGWQYLSFFMGRYLALLKRRHSLSEEAFAHQLGLII